MSKILFNANPAGCTVFLCNLYTAVWEGHDIVFI